MTTECTQAEMGQALLVPADNAVLPLGLTGTNDGDTCFPANGVCRAAGSFGFCDYAVVQHRVLLSTVIYF